MSAYLAYCCPFCELCWETVILTVTSFNRCGCKLYLKRKWSLVEVPPLYLRLQRHKGQMCDAKTRIYTYTIFSTSCVWKIVPFFFAFWVGATYCPECAHYYVSPQFSVRVSLHVNTDLRKAVLLKHRRLLSVNKVISWTAKRETKSKSFELMQLN